MKVTSNIYQISGSWGTAEILGGNVFILLDKKITLIDTGFRMSAGRIIRCIEKLGYHPTDVSDIIITHHHADHTGELGFLKKMVTARVLVHSADAPFIDGREEQPGPSRPDWLKRALNPFKRFWATVPVYVDITLKDGDELPVLGGIKILHTPGHTPGSISLFIPREKVLILGDLLTHGTRLKLPSREFTVDKCQEIDSIGKICSVNAEIVCFGHGPPLRGNPGLQINDFYQFLRQKYAV